MSRTDLALEAAERLPGLQELTSEDMTTTTSEEEGILITRIDIRSPAAERAIGKPRGTYITVEMPPLTDNGTILEDTACRIGSYVRELLPEGGTVLVVGLGNEAITPDALGPQAVKMVLATRHIEGEFARSTGLEDLRPTVVMAAGVLGNTGVESGEMVSGVATVVKPKAVIAIDALAARSLSRLGCTVQISNTGITPGSGVGNRRLALDEKTLGVPVIGIGVPTVVDAATLVAELTEGKVSDHAVAPRGEQMMVTPREVDLMIVRAARLVAMIVNAALQPSYSPLDLIEVAK